MSISPISICCALIATAVFRVNFAYSISQLDLKQDLRIVLSSIPPVHLVVTHLKKLMYKN